MKKDHFLPQEDKELVLGFEVPDFSAAGALTYAGNNAQPDTTRFGVCIDIKCPSIKVNFLWYIFQ